MYKVCDRAYTKCTKCTVKEVYKVYDEAYTKCTKCTVKKVYKVYDEAYTKCTECTMELRLPRDLKKLRPKFFKIPR